MDLQSAAAEAELERVEEMAVRLNMQLRYDYEGGGFQLELERPVRDAVQRVGIHLRSCWVERQNHPHLRDKLYFHELKDIEKHYDLPYPRNSPSASPLMQSSSATCSARTLKTSYWTLTTH